jgi:hypothetical protein
MLAQHEQDQQGADSHQDHAVVTSNVGRAEDMDERRGYDKEQAGQEQQSTKVFPPN